MKDPRTREPRGFAFVTFVEVGPAEEAVQALNGTNLDGRSIIVEKAKRGRARTREYQHINLNTHFITLVLTVSDPILLSYRSHSWRIPRT